MIDDDEAVRHSLAFLLRTAKIEVQAYELAGDFLDGCACTSNRDALLPTCECPRSAASTSCGTCRELKIGLPVIVITGHGDVPLAVEAMKAGAADFLEKPFDDDVLLASRALSLGQGDRQCQQASSRTFGDRRPACVPVEFASATFLVGLVAGHANKRIAYDLGISPRTVEIYRANLMGKMQAASLSDLVRMALIAGILAGKWPVMPRQKDLDFSWPIDLVFGSRNMVTCN